MKNETPDYVEIAPVMSDRPREPWAKHRAAIVRWQKARPLAVLAHKLVKKAIARGELPEQTTQKCADCGSQARCYDHRDYTKPLEVEPVCHRCNAKRGPAYPYLAVS